MRMIVFLFKINPRFFYEKIFITLLELEKYMGIFKVNQKITIGRSHLINELKYISLFQEESQFYNFISENSKNKVN